MFSLIHLTILLILIHLAVNCKGSDCPEDKCPAYRPNARCGKITITAYYDNDIEGDSVLHNYNLISRLCQALNEFGDEFSVEFIIGASITIYNKHDLTFEDCNEIMKIEDEIKFATVDLNIVEHDDTTGEIKCRASDCTKDRLDGCAHLHVKNFNKFVCCKIEKDSVYTCTSEQGVKEETIRKCVDERSSDVLLYKNGQERININIPTCYLPEFLINWQLDRCVKFTSYDELKNVLCDYYKAANIASAPCENN